MHGLIAQLFRANKHFGLLKNVYFYLKNHFLKTRFQVKPLLHHWLNITIHFIVKNTILVMLSICLEFRLLNVGIPSKKCIKKSARYFNKDKLKKLLIYHHFFTFIYLSLLEKILISNCYFYGQNSLDCPG